MSSLLTKSLGNCVPVVSDTIVPVLKSTEDPAVARVSAIRPACSKSITDPQTAVSISTTNVSNS